jgi:hypothetical protein
MRPIAVAWTSAATSWSVRESATAPHLDSVPTDGSRQRGKISVMGAKQTLGRHGRTAAPDPLNETSGCAYLQKNEPRLWRPGAQVPNRNAHPGGTLGRDMEITMAKNAMPAALSIDLSQTAKKHSGDVCLGAASYRIGWQGGQGAR